MAVKPILNKQIVARPNINRGKQISTKGMKYNGNQKESILPGKDFAKNFSVTLKDIDSSMMSHVKDVMKLSIREGGENIKVPVLYGNEERWKNIKKNGALRDKNGSLILPLMMIRRTDVNFTDAMPFSYDADVKGLASTPVRANKWGKENRYDRFSIQTNKKPIQEMITTGVPDWVDCTYSVVAVTNYIEQMNAITEAFVFHESTYWGESLGFKFLATLGGSFAVATEMDVAGERIVRLEFEVILKGYLLPEVYSYANTDKVFDIGRKFSVGKVVFGQESDATADQVK